jgi:carbon storage regulator
MLVLGRRPGESVICGEGENALTVTILEIRGNTIRIGFDAPAHIRVNRAEVAERMHQQQEGDIA